MRSAHRPCPRLNRAETELEAWLAVGRCAWPATHVVDGSSRCFIRVEYQCSSILLQPLARTRKESISTVTPFTILPHSTMTSLPAPPNNASTLHAVLIIIPHYHDVLPSRRAPASELRVVELCSKTRELALSRAHCSRGTVSTVPTPVPVSVSAAAHVAPACGCTMASSSRGKKRVGSFFLCILTGPSGFRSQTSATPMINRQLLQLNFISSQSTENNKGVFCI
jgi:hypothetical protein